MECFSWSSVAALGFVVFCCVSALGSESVFESLPEVENAAESLALRMDLSARDPSCQGMLLQSKGDRLLDRVHCALRKGLIRLNSISLRKFQGHVVDSIAQVTAGGDYETDVGAAGGDYVGRIALGTPAKSFSVIVDTGSDLVWIQCNPCVRCFNQTDHIFTPAASHSFRPLSCSNALCKALTSRSCSRRECQYAYFYGDGSGSKGELAAETISLARTDGKLQAVRDFAFGCGHRNSGTFTGASGILGLGRGRLSFPSQLGALFGHKFSYCLVTWTLAPSRKSPMLFGEGAVPQKQGLRYTPMLANPNPNYDTFYYVQLDAISVAGSKLAIPRGAFDMRADGSGGVILDSGTTLTYLPNHAYAPLLRALRAHIALRVVDSSPYGLDLCYDVSQARGLGAPAASFPSLVFHFKGADYEMPVENVFIPVTSAGDVWCLAMAESSQGFSIFGNIQQQNFHILYDLKNSQIGFAPTTCASA